MWPVGLQKESNLTPPISPSPPQMVETNVDLLSIPSGSIAKKISLKNQNYLTTAMLLGTQNCNYLGQRLQNHLRERYSDNSDQTQSNPQLTAEQQAQQQTQRQLQNLNQRQIRQEQEPKIKSNINNNCSSTPTSLFTIDSILASKPGGDIKMEYRSDSQSPSNSPPLSTTPSPIRPTRVPAILHPGLHLGHLAAAAASGFGTPSDFLGESELILFFCLKYLF